MKKEEGDAAMCGEIRCIDVSTVQQSLLRVHSRFTCCKCDHICVNHADLQQHLTTTTAQTRPAGAMLATRVLTPSKNRVKRVTSYVAYNAAKMEDQLRLLESSELGVNQPKTVGCLTVMGQMISEACWMNTNVHVARLHYIFEN